jgi:spermidine synthase
MNQFTRRVLFFLFFVSGFCSLVYQVVWTRMAFASFGIITPVLSVVLSVFMLGLAVGSWLGGQMISGLVRKTGLSAVFFYAGAEFMIGLGAFMVPKLFAVGEGLLLTSGETDSFRYLSLSAVVLAASILPWCICMGTTFPLMMAYIRERDDSEAKSFSFLYLANVLGAMSGTFLTAVFFVETWGFHHTLWQAAAGNFTAAFVSLCLGLERRRAPAPLQKSTGQNSMAETSRPSDSGSAGMIKWILFSTGFAAMAMEVVWTRAFTPVMQTQVYSFAMIVFTYLGATFLGSWIYRRHLGKSRQYSIGGLIAALAATAFLPVVANDTRLVTAPYWMGAIHFKSVLILLCSICPFCVLLGYLTPSLVDRYAGGNPAIAGRAYAINVLGCILGPLFACYVLLPVMNERYALILLGLPFIVFWLAFLNSQLQKWRWVTGLAIAVVLAQSTFFCRDFETNLIKGKPHTVVRRDYAASVASFGEGFDRWLLVNGIGMTRLTPVTKFMVHVPLSFHEGQPKSALVICFGMGTSYRSAMSWGIDTTAVELVPSVTKAFGFYHTDTERYLNVTNGHIIIDDGRRFLKRTNKKFDVIIVDPPPPVVAAGSSLLYSREFYALARQHLNTNGILQMWFPGGETLTAQAVVRSIHESFPFVRCFPSIEGWGLHLLASENPITSIDPQKITARMPESAKKDLLEWYYPSQDVTPYINRILSNEVSIPSMLNPDLKIQITDDQPFNEYYLLRQWGMR